MKTLLRILFKPLTIINRLIRKKQNRIFLYTNLGFRDNVRAFYEYLIREKYNEIYEIIVSANDAARYRDTAPNNVRFIGNKRGIILFMRSKYAFYCFGKYPIKPAGDQVVVNLWHGTPLKKIGNLEKGFEKVDYDFFTTVITNSKLHVPIMAKIFGCDEKKVDVQGYPRCDALFFEDKLTDDYIRGSRDKVILWLPTYREYDNRFMASLPGLPELKQLDDYLTQTNCRLIIKLHPLQHVSEEFAFENLEIMEQSDIERRKMTVYSLLRNADALITDYSSVYFDYLLLDRPMAFYIDDIDTYDDKRGFVLDSPEDYMPGKIIVNMQGVLEFIEDVIGGRDDYSDKRAKINDLVNFYRDGSNSRRIAEKYIK